MMVMMPLRLTLMPLRPRRLVAGIDGAVAVRNGRIERRPIVIVIVIIVIIAIVDIVIVRLDIPFVHFLFRFRSGSIIIIIIIITIPLPLVLIRRNVTLESIRAALAGGIGGLGKRQRGGIFGRLETVHAHFARHDL